MCFLTHIHGKEFQTLPELNNVDFTTVRQKQEGKDSREQEEEKKMAAGQRSKQKKRKEKKICFFNLHSSPLPPRVENCWKVFLEFSSLVAKWKGWPWAALFPHMSFIFSICPSPASPSLPSLDSHISSRQLTGSLPLWPFFSLISRPLRLLSCSRFNASSDSDSRCRQTPGTAADRFHVLQITGLIFLSSAPNPFFENIFLRPPPCPAPLRPAPLCCAVLTVSS